MFNVLIFKPDIRTVFSILELCTMSMDNFGNRRLLSRDVDVQRRRGEFVSGDESVILARAQTCLSAANSNSFQGRQY